MMLSYEHTKSQTKRKVAKKQEMIETKWISNLLALFQGLDHLIIGELVHHVIPLDALFLRDSQEGLG